MLLLILLTTMMFLMLGVGDHMVMLLMLVLTFQAGQVAGQP